MPWLRAWTNPRTWYAWTWSTPIPETPPSRDFPGARELSRTLTPMDLGLPARDALENLLKQTEVAELSNFVVALTEANALGKPTGRVPTT